jgi:DNA-binding MarR family transcriptional regulator
MTRSGLVSRRDDEQDRRVKRLALTDTGRAAVTRITEARNAGLARVVDQLDDDQRAALSAALAPLLPDPSTTPGCSS